ncbi:hypothetical protein [Actinacidiphila glaucinigra]|uniref:hypothetical protein n=1 Tax=Actinacidiphila glaucinigra TaxID=235986 RepID=UPI00371BB027
MLTPAAAAGRSDHLDESNVCAKACCVGHPLRAPAGGEQSTEAEPTPELSRAAFQPGGGL